MFKFKKIVALFLVSLMVVVSLTACGEKAGEAQPAEPNTEKENTSKTEWPKKTIQVTVPYSAGGDTDIYSRLASKYLEEILGQTIVIVNTPGASGILASKQVMAEKPDGYNILFNHTAGLIQEATGLADFSYADSFTAGGTVASDNTYTMVCRADSGWTSLKDVVDYAKANPGKVSFSQVNGSVTHYVSKQFEDSAGIELNKLDVGSSSADRVAAFLGGQVDLLIVNYTNIKDYIENGDFIALGVTAPERVETLPELPTFIEQGYDVVATKTYSFKFPKGTDQAIVDKFTTALEEVSKKPNFKEELAKFYAVPVYKTPEKTVEDEKADVENIKKIMEGVFNN